MDRELESHLSKFFSPRAVAYFKAGGAVRHSDRHADRKTLLAALERLGLPAHKSVLQVEERYGGIEVDDDYQWMLGPYDSMVEADSAGWMARSSGEKQLVFVAACATSNAFVDEEGRLYEDFFEVGQFHHSADSLEARVERDAIFLDMALNLKHGGRETLVGHHGLKIARVRSLDVLPEASDSRETWWQNHDLTIADVIDFRSGTPQTWIFGRDEQPIPGRCGEEV